MAQIISLGTSRGDHTQQVPLLDLKRQYAEICDDMDVALRSVSDSGQFVLGPEVKKLEQNLAAYCQVDHAVGCASGSDALLLSLMACDIKSGDEVIVPSFTFFATASAVTRLGATPIFADVEPKSFNIDPHHVAQLINEKTKAIIPVNLFGQMAEMKTLNDLVRGRNIAMIEDSAQAIGAELENRRTGSWGDMCALSFYPTKNLGGVGDGGMVVTNNATFADKLRLLRGHGMEPRYYHSIIGINSRLDSYQAAALNVKLPHLDKWTTMRKQNADRYNALFCDADLDEMVVYPETLPNRRHVWNQYVIRVPNGLRDAMRQELTESKIGTEIYYPLGLHEQECFRYLGYALESLPETFRATREVIALPIYPELTEQEQIFVVEKIKQFCEKQRQFTLPKAA
ncbi:MAG: DegT/DnrJ/EryC1/StrS family aminotransferase [Planctomycetaceae bacterium]|jgi:dTDP-4-amino-4,6-dideoxygalactose transaminase|nr:DegT/DnrJ/EryC1/StrS family aminotransferase [Planctomycetaceae bacterium]